MAAATMNGALLKSHEARLQHVEEATSSLLATSSATAVKLEGIGSIVVGIDKKLDTYVDALVSHKTDDVAVDVRVRDLEQKQKSKDKFSKNVNYAFLTALAGIVGDLVLRLAEHLKFFS